MYPLLDRADIVPFFSDRMYTEQMKAYFEGWAEQTYGVVDQLRKQKSDQMIKEVSKDVNVSSQRRSCRSCRG